MVSHFLKRGSAGFTEVGMIETRKLCFVIDDELFWPDVEPVHRRMPQLLAPIVPVFFHTITLVAYFSENKQHSA